MREREITQEDIADLVVVVWHQIRGLALKNDQLAAGVCARGIARPIAGEAGRVGAEQVQLVAQQINPIRSLWAL
jgi:hypothetical protein